MKTSGSLDSGTLQAAYYASYAEYFVRFVAAYRAAGVNVAAISAQNEPENAASDYPAMGLTASAEATFIGDYLGPALAHAGLSALKILGYDHNWSDPTFPTSLLRSSAAPYLSGTAFHCYAGDPTAQMTVHDVAPTKGIWFTECSGGSWSPDFATNLGWNSANLLVGTLRNWAQTMLYWNIALNANGGPHSGGCSGCRGVITVGSDGSITRNVEFAELEQASSVVEPGATRIDSPASVDGVETVAFANPDGSRAMIVDNSWGNDRVINVTDGTGRVVSTALPGGSTLSLRWTD